MAARRSTAQMAVDQDAIVAFVAADGLTWVRPPKWARPGDVKALVDAGRLRREVRKEYDHQRGHTANMFGGAGMMVRHRSYLALPAEVPVES